MAEYVVAMKIYGYLFVISHTKCDVSDNVLVNVICEWLGIFRAT